MTDAIALIDRLEAAIGSLAAASAAQDDAAIVDAARAIGKAVEVLPSHVGIPAQGVAARRLETVASDLALALDQLLANLDHNRRLQLAWAEITGLSGLGRLATRPGAAAYARQSGQLAR